MGVGAVESKMGGQLNQSFRETLCDLKDKSGVLNGSEVNTNTKTGSCEGRKSY